MDQLDDMGPPEPGDFDDAQVPFGDPGFHPEALNVADLGDLNPLEPTTTVDDGLAGLDTDEAREFLHRLAASLGASDTVLDAMDQADPAQHAMLYSELTQDDAMGRSTGFGFTLGISMEEAYFGEGEWLDADEIAALREGIVDAGPPISGGIPIDGGENPVPGDGGLFDADLGNVAAPPVPGGLPVGGENPVPGGLPVGGENPVPGGLPVGGENPTATVPATPGGGLPTTNGSPVENGTPAAAPAAPAAVPGMGDTGPGGAAPAVPVSPAAASAVPAAPAAPPSAPAAPAPAAEAIPPAPAAMPVVPGTEMAPPTTPTPAAVGAVDGPPSADMPPAGVPEMPPMSAPGFDTSALAAVGGDPGHEASDGPDEADDSRATDRILAAASAAGGAAAGAIAGVAAGVAAVVRRRPSDEDKEK